MQLVHAVQLSTPARPRKVASHALPCSMWISGLFGKLVLLPSLGAVSLL